MCEQTFGDVYHVPCVEIDPFNINDFILHTRNSCVMLTRASLDDILKN